MERLRYLDALRGCAALYVMAFHVAFLPPFFGVSTGKLPSELFPLVQYGGQGVTLFFVVSAFSLCLTMPRHLATGSPVASFYLSRFFRIAPLFWLVMLGMYVAGMFVLHQTHSVLELFVNGAFIFNFFPQWQTSLVMGGWTVGVEMIFYVFFPFIYVFIIGRFRKAMFFLSSVILYLVSYVIFNKFFAPGYLPPLYAEASIFTQFPVFLIGIFAFDLVEALKTRFAAPRIGMVFIAMGLLGLALEIYWGFPRGPFAKAHVGAIFWALLLSGLALFPWKLIVNRITCFYGKISYSLYILHGMVILLMLPVYRQIFLIDVYQVMKYLICVIVTLAFLTPLSFLGYNFIERPGIKLGKMFIEKISFRRTISTTTSKPERLFRL